MSRDEQIYLDPGHRRERETAVAVAKAVNGRFIENSMGYGASLSLDVLEHGCFLTGSIDEHEAPTDLDPEDPTDHDIFDPYPLVWTVSSGPHRDGALSRRGARLAFQRLVDAQLGWPMVLTHNSGELIATFDRERGLREFPPGTSTDRTDQHLWG